MIVSEIKNYLSNRALLVLLVLIIATPIFVYAAELVEYSEPLENIAEEFGAEENPLYSGIFTDYTIPGINSYVGTMISAFIGVLATIVLITVILKLISGGRKDGSNS